MRTKHYLLQRQTMRQIKFRVYCKGTHPTNRNFQKAGGWSIGDCILNKYYDMLTILSGRDDPEFNEHFELRQYTGSRSSKFEEIFEGDIVRFYLLGRDSSETQEGTVKYVELSAKFVVVTNNNSYRFNEIIIL